MSSWLQKGIRSGLVIAVIAAVLPAAGIAHADMLGVVITSPTDGTTGLTGAVSITATVTPGANPIQGVQFQIDGGNIGLPVNSPAAGTMDYSNTWNSTTIGNGSHVIRVIAIDTSNAQASMNITVVTANPVAANTAPAISTIAVTAITAFGATVTWNTDVSSDTRVVYGPDTSYGGSSPLISNPVTSHTAILNNLKPNTTYHYQVISTGSFGTSTSADATFQTLTTAGTPAIVQITSPLTNSVTTGTPSVTFTATAGNAAPVSAQLIVDGNNFGSPVALTGTGSYSIVWNTQTATQVCHIIAVAVTDQSGVVGTSPTQAVYVVNVANTDGTFSSADPGHATRQLRLHWHCTNAAGNADQPNPANSSGCQQPDRQPGQ